jgi:hypothetical protein
MEGFGADFFELLATVARRSELHIHFGPFFYNDIGSLIKDEAGLVKHEIEHYPFPPGYSNPYMSEKGKQAQRSLVRAIQRECISQQLAYLRNTYCSRSVTNIG